MSHYPNVELVTLAMLGNNKFDKTLLKLTKPIAKYNQLLSILLYINHGLEAALWIYQK